MEDHSVLFLVVDWEIRHVEDHYVLLLAVD